MSDAAKSNNNAAAVSASASEPAAATPADEASPTKEAAASPTTPRGGNNHNNNHSKSHNKLKSTQNSSGGGSIDKLSPDQDIYINAADGLPSQHPSLPKEGIIDSDTEPEVDADSFDDLPTSIIVTNIHSEVFANPELKHGMEELFRTFSETATFQWLRSFRRLRVNYDNAIAAANARIKLHQYEFNKKTVITCYFAQPVTPVNNKNLQPPAPVKQFLISPPASPPAGWEPREEAEPLVNHDLLAALASLTPGESHELHPQSEDQPAIIVHTAMVPEGAGGIQAKAPIVQTKCPERA
ncbi:protein sarah [Drosophila subobscura]|uniref:protein sarah n=1 Tax=Drosophila subobscura TaxID=7241 RepID=UPI00155AC113|nr:protein sarah [Drosophila subobscura]XP_034660293.1 protein sarah [Drosophila subobscura]